MLNSVHEVTAKIKAGVPGRWAVGAGAYLQVARTGERATAHLAAPLRAGRQDGVGRARSDRAGRLAEARDKALAMRKLRLDGIDPLQAQARQARGAARQERARLSFRDAAEHFLAVHEARWRNAKHRTQWRTTSVDRSSRSSAAVRSPASIRR